jgi:hypothetical protein
MQQLIAAAAAARRGLRRPAARDATAVVGSGLTTS